MFNSIQVSAQGRPVHNLDDVLRNFLCDPCNVRMRIILLKNSIWVSLKNVKNVRAWHLINLSLCCYVIPATRTKTYEDDGLQ